MTVTYTQQVATAKYGFYVQLLFRWRGSIYKLLWKEFLLFLILHYLLRVIYRNILGEAQKRIFEQISVYANSYSVLIPFSFVLGFYMQVIFQRWLAMFGYIAWPDAMALAVTANIKGLDERGRLIRRTIMRYMIVGYILNQRSVCPSIKRRFPTINHLTQAGILTLHEEKIIEDIEQTRVNKYVIPFLWTVNIIALARKEGRIYDDYAVKVLNQELMTYRIGLGMILRYDIASIPLVYTQSVTLAVNMFIIFTLFGKQFLEQRQDGGAGDIDQFVHLGALLQFLLYMGWLKLAEMMINPFGDDDDDFDMNILIDRNLQYCYLVVDDLHSDLPPLHKDMYWNETVFHLPYTAALLKSSTHTYTELGSAYEVTVPEDKSTFVTMSDDSSQPIRKFSLESPRVSRNSEVPRHHSHHLSTHSLDSAHDKGKANKSEKSKKPPSAASLLNAKLFIESMGHQFRASDPMAQRNQDPFDYRFEEDYEKDYKRPQGNLEDEDDDDDSEDSDPSEERKTPEGVGHLPAASVNAAIAGMRRFLRAKRVIERQGSTVGIVGTSAPKHIRKSLGIDRTSAPTRIRTSKRSTTMDTPQVPPKPPPPPPPPSPPSPSPQASPRVSGVSWKLPMN